MAVDNEVTALEPSLDMIIWRTPENRFHQLIGGIEKLREMKDDSSIEEITGARTFWHLQQNQDIQTDPDWQKNILEMELKVSGLPEYKNIACLHYIIFRNKK